MGVLRASRFGRESPGRLVLLNGYQILLQHDDDTGEQPRLRSLDADQRRRAPYHEYDEAGSGDDEFHDLG